jgi:hypothetical protein
LGENDNATNIGQNFHQVIKKSQSSTSILDDLDSIEDTFLDLMPVDGVWAKIRNDFVVARKKRSPKPIVTAYTRSKELTRRLNTHSAANTHHSLILYCTPLSCPILAQTQEYTQAFTRILFHPALDELLVRKERVYRGLVIEEQILIDNFKECVVGKTIITTTFLSTSKKSSVAEMFGDGYPDNSNRLEISCTYNILNTCRRTALDISTFSMFESEEEVLILPYVPFQITALQWTTDGRRMTICFQEFAE